MTRKRSIALIALNALLATGAALLAPTSSLGAADRALCEDDSHCDWGYQACMAGSDRCAPSAVGCRPC